MFIIFTRFQASAIANILALISNNARNIIIKTGDICIKRKQNKIHLRWSPSECAVLPNLQRVLSKSGLLSRVFFFMKELGDTSENSSAPDSFKLTILGCRSI